MASKESTTRSRVKTIVDAISGSPVVTSWLGLADFAPTKEFLRTLGTTTVTHKALTSNVATLTFASHKFAVGQRVRVALTTPDATFDGIQEITQITSTTISYPKTAANVASTAAPGTVTAGPCLFIRPARTAFNMTNKNKNFRVDSELWFGFAANADYTFTAIEDVLFDPTTGVLTALVNEDNYSDCAPPMEVQEVEEPELDTSQDPIVGKYRLTMSFKGC